MGAHAERAVRAGLRDSRGCAPNHKTIADSAACGSGIATGIVVVGDLLGSGEAQERGIVGDTPNLAARLQVIAEPDMVVIAEGTRELLGNLFELQDLKPRTSRALPVRRRPGRRCGRVPRKSRFEAARERPDRAGRAGRGVELLLRRWTGRRRRGSGGAALRRGRHRRKSRLTAAMERLEATARLRYFCSPPSTPTARSTQSWARWSGSRRTGDAAGRSRQA